MYQTVIEEVATKTIRDWEGFWTEYALYYNPDEKLYFCVYGDTDLYSPYDSDHDMEFGDDREAALLWFEGYGEEDSWI